MRVLVVVCLAITGVLAGTPVVAQEAEALRREIACMVGLTLVVCVGLTAAAALANRRRVATAVLPRRARSPVTQEGDSPW